MRRRTGYLILMAVCLTLFLGAWLVVRRYSVGAAVAMSAVAAVLPPLAAIYANRPSDHD